MQIENVEFAGLEKELSKAGISALNYLASETGKVYIVTITREGCPACQKQKPKLDKLAASLKQNHKKVVFIRIHVKRPPTSEEESIRSKSVFGHYFYPTNLILLRTKDRGAFEYYRGISPPMSELGRNIKNAVDTATMLDKQRK
jgi:thiol-disulfide isomerase/thioredoxin